MAVILRWVHRFRSNFSLKLRNYIVGKVKKFEHMVAIEKNVQSRIEEAVGL